MKIAGFALFAVSAFAQSSAPAVSNAKFETRTVAGDLATVVRASTPAWFGYSIQSQKTDDDHWSCNDRLEQNTSGSIQSSRPNGPVHLEGSTELAVLLRVENNTVGRVRIFSFQCPIDAGGLPFVWLTGVSDRASIQYLKTLLSGTNHSVVEGAIWAIAQHASKEADTVLSQLADPSQPEQIREKIAFGLGAKRGAPGVVLLKKMMAGDPSERVRDKVVFAFSVSKQPEALTELLHAAKFDPAAHVRSQALFWLGQKANKQSAAAITDAIENDPDTNVKKQAVFALSQLPKDESVPKLIDLARTQKNLQVRKQAFFWLGQSNDPRALAFFEEVLAK